MNYSSSSNGSTQSWPPEAAGHGEKLSRRGEALIAALLVEGSIAEAAKKAGIGARTARRWLRNPGFSEAYKRARRENFAEANARLQLASGEAVQTLRDSLGDESGSVRIRAAIAILQFSINNIQIEDLTDRVQRLEELEKRAIN